MKLLPCGLASSRRLRILAEYPDNSGRGQENLSQRLSVLHRIRELHNRGATEVEVRSG